MVSSTGSPLPAQWRKSTPYPRCPSSASSKRRSAGSGEPLPYRVEEAHGEFTEKVGEAKAQLAERVDDAREQLADAKAQLSEKMDDAKEQLAAVHEMRSDERRAQTEAAREQLQAKLDELQRRFDERAAALGRTRKSLLRGNPTARSERYTEVLERLKKRLDTHTHR